MKNKLIRVLSALLCVVICIAFSGCSVLFETIESIIRPKGIVEDTSLGYTQIDNSDFIYSPHYTPKKCTNSYDLLENDNLRTLYDMLLENIYYIYPQATSGSEHKTKQVVYEDVLLSEADVRVVIKALTDDHPQVFWLSTTFGYLMSTDLNYTAVQLYSHFSPEKVGAMQEELNTKVNDFFASLEDSMTEYELELYIHDEIVDMCEYDEEVVLDDIQRDKLNAFDPYGVMVLNKAVCEGYARTFQMLMSGVGIECINIIGDSQDELHMWNAVKLDSDWYYVDTTWDDNPDASCRYDYFNINEKQLKEDHDFSPTFDELTDEQICGDSKINATTANFVIPQCTQTSFNYYVRSAPHLTDYDGGEVTDRLYEATLDKDEFFHIYIEPDKLTYDYAVDSLFFSYPQYFFNYAEEVNWKIPDYAIDMYNLSIVEKEHLNVITVFLEYI